MSSYAIELRFFQKSFPSLLELFVYYRIWDNNFLCIHKPEQEIQTPHIMQRQPTVGTVCF